MSEFMKIRYDLLTPNPYSRPQYKMEGIRGIVVHWVGNPNSTDYENRNFFNNRQYGNDGYGSAHEIIDLDASILIVIPDYEMAYHVGANSYMDGIFERLNTTYPNSVLYGIEFTHPDWTGKPNDITYKALVYRLAELCERYGLDPHEDIYRHYDITSKECPRYYVRNESEFKKLKEEVANKMTTNNWEDWLVNDTIEAIEKLAKLGKIDTPEMHIKKIKEENKIENWLLLLVLARVAEDNKSQTVIDINELAERVAGKLKITLNKN